MVINADRETAPMHGIRILLCFFMNFEMDATIVRKPIPNGLCHLPCIWKFCAVAMMPLEHFNTVPFILIG